MVEEVERWVALGHVDDTPHPKSGAGLVHVAAAKGYVSVLSRLFESPLRRQVALETRDAEGWTPLAAAVHWQQSAAVQLLLAAGASTAAVAGRHLKELARDNQLVLQLLADHERQRARESETQRRAHAKRVRESRRSTQVTEQSISFLNLLSATLTFSPHFYLNVIVALH